MKDNFKVKRKNRGGIEEAISVDLVNDIDVGRKVKRWKDRPYESEKGERNKEKTVKDSDKKEEETSKEKRLIQENIGKNRDKDISNNNIEIDKITEPMMMEDTSEEELAREEDLTLSEDKEDGFRTVVRRSQNKAFEKLVQIKGIFTDIDRMTEEDRIIGE